MDRVGPATAYPDRSGAYLPRHGTVYRAKGMLAPEDVRRQRFSLTGLGRRGLSPNEVGRFLRRVERQLTALHREIVAARDEADRCRRALRQWSGAHTHCHFRPIEPPPRTPTNSPNWALRVGGRPDRRTRG